MSSITYLGRFNNFISGLTALVPGGVGILQMPVNRRYHRMNLNASAIAYQSPRVFVFSGTGAIVTPTIDASGQITALTLSGTLANYNTGAGQLIVVDPLGTGRGAIGTINFTAANAATVALTTGGSGYSSSTFVVVIGGAGAGNTAPVVTATVTNGVITALAITSAGTGTPLNATPANNQALIVDSNYVAANGQTYNVGQGATATVTGVTTQTLTGITLGSGGTVAATPPELVLQQIKMLVNGVNMRDITVSLLMRIIAANQFPGPTGNGAYYPQTGELPLFFTEPWRNELQHNETLSWDLTGQSTFELDFIVQSNITSPALTGSYEFDYRRNQRPQSPGSSTMVPFLNPIAHHAFTFPIPGGQTDITFLPVKYPIIRMWVLLNSAAGALQFIELLAVGNKIFEQTIAQNQQTLAEYGFNPFVFSGAYVFDMDQRPFKALGFSSDAVPGDMIVRLTSANAGNATIVMETMPGAFR